MPVKGTQIIAIQNITIISIFFNWQRNYCCINLRVMNDKKGAPRLQPRHELVNDLMCVFQVFSKCSCVVGIIAKVGLVG